MRLVFVVPALNERENLPVLAQRMVAAAQGCAVPASVVLVDDGSTDGTADLARELLRAMQVRIVPHRLTLGPGPSFRDGFAAALENAGDDDLVVTVEADNASDLAALPTLVHEARLGADLVLGSCYAPGGGVEGAGEWRMLVALIANTVVRVWFGLWRMHTFTSFYRVHRAGMLREVFAATDKDPMHEPGFASVIEMLARVHAMGYRVAEVPVVLRPFARPGKRRARVLPMILGTLRVMGRLGPFACRVRWRRRREAASQ